MRNDKKIFITWLTVLLLLFAGLHCSADGGLWGRKTADKPKDAASGEPLNQESSEENKPTEDDAIKGSPPE